MPLPSITRDELRTLFNLPDEAIDALMSSGRILCHVRGNEIRFPLEQLESFFRDGLVRVYQAMGDANRSGTAADASAPAGIADANRQAVGVDANRQAVVAAGFSPPLDDRAEPERDEEPGGLKPAATTDSQVENRAGTEQPELLPLRPVVARPAPEPDPIDDRPNMRVAQRWVPRRQIDGTFKSARFSILQMSSSGLRIRHVEPLMPGDEAKLSFALMSPARSFVMRARVVWTSVAKSEDGDATFCISGLRVTEHAERLAGAIDLLRKSHDLAPEERRKQVRPPDMPANVAAIDNVSDDDVALVVRAAQHFATDPIDASRWYGRARFALSEEHVRRDAPPRPRDREEVLGIWEYLERQVDIQTIAGVLTWMRRTRQAQA